MPVSHLTLLALLSTLAMSGCRLPGGDGPVSHSLAASRGYCQQGVAAMEQGELKDAESLLGQAVRVCPADPEARRRYAEILWQRGERPKAIAQLQEAIRVGGENAEIHVALAQMRLEMGDGADARHHADRAIDLDPRLSAAWAIRARISLAEGNRRAALDDYHRALGLAPDDREVRLAIAEVYRQLNQPQRALSMLQVLADTYTPGEEPQKVIYLEGLAYAALGRHQEAVDAFTLAADRGKPTAEILCRLAESELQLDCPGPAAEMAQQALLLDPHHRPSQEVLARAEVALGPDNVTRR